MVDSIALANMRHWIIDKTEDNKKNLRGWQFSATFVGILISIVTAIGLFFISKPLALSAFIVLGLSFIVPLFVQSVPFSNDHLMVLATRKRYERAIIDTLSEMNVGIKSIKLPESVLDKDVKIRTVIGGSAAEISMREVDGEIKFYHNNVLLIANPHIHGPYELPENCPTCIAFAA